MRKRFLSVFLALSVILISTGVANADTVTVWEGPTKGYEWAIFDGRFSGGDGTENSPYVISTAEQLIRFSESVNEGKDYSDEYVILENDITLNDTTNWEFWNETNRPENEWTPIGQIWNEFKGTFDGAGHTISGIYVNVPVDPKGVSEPEGIGLFGWASNFVIKNVNVTDSVICGGGYVGGIIGYPYFGDIINCNNSARVIGTNYTGGIAGINDGGRIIKCSNEVSGEVIGYRESNGTYTGGIAGHNGFDSYIAECRNSANINGIKFVGGIAGDNEGMIFNSSNESEAKVVGSNYIGGISGYNHSHIDMCYNLCGGVYGGNNVGGISGYNGGHISDCYNSHLIEGNECIGGITGYNHNGDILNCYNTGEIVGNKYTGGLIGINDKNQITDGGLNCYYLNDCCEETDGCGTALSGSEMLNKCSYIGFDFKNVWTIAPETGYSYPQLIVSFDKYCGEKSAVWNGSVADGFAVCSYPLDIIVGTEATPYIIETAEQLAYFAQCVNNGFSFKDMYIKLNADIVLNDTSKKYWILNATQWVPIGISDDCFPEPFEGTFDGNGHTISGIYISSPDSHQGLFGNLKNGTVKNLGVINSFINAGSINLGWPGCTGAVVGESYYGNIMNCSNSGAVRGSDNIGGIVGSVTGGTVSDCHNTGMVTRNNGVSGTGGIAGVVNGTVVSNCYNEGDIYGTVDIGGIVGLGRTTSSNIINSYNTGFVNGMCSVGGLVGFSIDMLSNCYNLGAVSGTEQIGGIAGVSSIEKETVNCYNSGTVSGTKQVGGIVGLNYNNIKSCYNNGNVAGVSDIGGIAGSVSYICGEVTDCCYLDHCISVENEYGTPLTESQMKSAQAFDGFDFEEVWASDSEINSGYPYLKNMTPQKQSITITIPNNQNIVMTSDSYNGVIIKALYDESEKLVDIKSYLPKEKMELGVDSPCTTAKIMWWESLNSLKPIWKIQSVSVEN